MSRNDASQPGQGRIRGKIAAPDFNAEALPYDLTREGVSLYCNREVTPGTLVSITLALLLGQNSASEDLRLTGKVLWSTPIKDSLYQLGVLFTGMDAKRMGYLDIFLRLLQQELVIDLEQDGFDDIELTPID